MRHRHARHQRVTLVLMIHNPSLPIVGTALLEPEPDVSRRATCPLCHTTDASLTADALEAGGTWRCVRCGQRWDADRLAAVAAYSAWVVERDTVSHGRGNPSALRGRSQ
jgi:transcription elongation factor Elf1